MHLMFDQDWVWLSKKKKKKRKKNRKKMTQRQNVAVKINQKNVYIIPKWWGLWVGSPFGLGVDLAAYKLHSLGVAGFARRSKGTTLGC